ncbi:MAG TPA: hypothetical protein VFV53_07955 [Candidatus Limnocylindrales bacterium]|nr:hypothetical protein [Candidatus Limnocylindrales bacterium]
MTAPASHERIYQALLRLYPKPFRARFGDELVQLTGDLLRDARAGRGGRGVAATWVRLLLDVALTAPAEHLEQRRLAHSLSRPPSAAMRALGLLGVAGGLVLVAAFVPNLPWTQELFQLRLVLFNGGAVAIAAVMLRSTSTAGSGRPQRATAVAAILANAWYLVMVVISVGRPQYPDPDPEFREIMLWAGVAMWWTDAAFGLALLRLRGLARWGALALAIGSVGAFAGMGHLRLVDGELAWFFLPAAVVGITLNGVGWILLGIAVAWRRRPIATASGAPQGG